VKPETLSAFEFGYKSEWLDGRVNLNATAFYYDYRNIQVNVVGPVSAAVGAATTSYLQNAKQGTSKGLELELEALATERLFLSASIGLLRYRFDELQVVNGGANLSGNEFVRSPHLTINAAANYRIPFSDGSRVVLGADTRYTAHQYYYVTPQDDKNRGLLNQPAYALTNARRSTRAPASATR
jgi:iron complex outermembrane receptor protein